MLIAPSPTPCDCPDCSSSPFPGFGTGGDLIQWLIGCGDSLLLKMEETSGSGMSRLPLISRLMKPYGNLYRAIAISGALAVGIAAYGSHGFKPENPKYKEVFATASQYHLLHTVALLATPLTPRPKLFAALIGGGVLLFSGSCYTVALKENREYGRLAPLGGLMLIGGWLSLFV